jgi:hypothetical protein
MIIQIPYDNAEVIKKGHDSMKAWHENMAKSHETAAVWHQMQSESMSKAMNEVPLDPEVKPAPKAGARGSSTDSPDSTPTPSKDVPMDPMKKADLVKILEDHIAEFGPLGIAPKDIVNIILGE